MDLTVRAAHVAHCFIEALAGKFIPVSIRTFAFMLAGWTNAIVAIRWSFGCGIYASSNVLNNLLGGGPLWVKSLDKLARNALATLSEGVDDPSLVAVLTALNSGQTVAHEPVVVLPAVVALVLRGISSVASVLASWVLQAVDDVNLLLR